MPCYSPLIGWRSRSVEAKTGKRKIVFNKDHAYTDLEVKVPCGQCIGCRLEKSRQWAVRCVHEAQLHSENSFITLTYAPEHLPESGTLVKKHFQDFMKRLRKFLYPKEIRFFHCGEYGSVRDNYGNIVEGRVGRPHYHAIIFGHQFDDLELFKETRGIKLYTSDKLEELWGKGFVTVGEVTFESAAYVARYVMKKATGDLKEERYLVPGDMGQVGPNGELCYIQDEYTTMSRRPGIAHDWFKMFKGDLEKDFVTLNGKKFMPPRYYDGLFEQDDPETFAKIKGARVAKGKANFYENTPDRREAREKVKMAQVEMLKREL
jgi:hypothetical protein